jgi:quercetin dioxygenase-like cupin family protein
LESRNESRNQRRDRLIGRKLAAKLQTRGYNVVAASPSTGVNSLTGEGLKKALTGANVVVDVTNSQSFEDNAVLDFFRSSTEHLLSAAAAGELPNVPGKSMRAVLVEYGPGAASPSHRHPSSAFIYATVLEGEFRSQVNDQPEHVYKAGESWTEMPGDTIR